VIGEPFISQDAGEFRLFWFLAGVVKKGNWRTDAETCRIPRPRNALVHPERHSTNHNIRARFKSYVYLFFSGRVHAGVVKKGNWCRSDITPPRKRGEVAPAAREL